MDQNAKCVPVTPSGKKITVERSTVIRGNRKAEQKDSRRRISCKDLGNGEYEGWLWSKKEKPGFGPNIWRKYWFMLKEKSLYCYKDPQDVVARRLYHLPAFVVSVARETSKKHAFKISHGSFGTVLFATKDFADMSKWMTHMILSCAEEPDTCRRKRSDESTGDISESDNEDENIEDEEEKKFLHPVSENDNETEDKDSTLAAPTAVYSSDSALSTSVAEFETESMPKASSHQGPTPLGSSAQESHLLKSCNSRSDPVRSSVAESASSLSSKDESMSSLSSKDESMSSLSSKDESTSSLSSKDESTPLPTSGQQQPQLLCHQPKSNSVNLASPEPESTTRTSEVFEPAVTAKKACGPATLSKPQPSLKSPLTSPKSPFTSPMSPLTSLKSPLTSPKSPFTSPMSPLTSLKSPFTSPKSPSSGESSVLPTLEKSSLTKPTFGPPATFVKPLRPIPSMDRQSSTTDVSTASLVPFAVAKLAFETASSSPSSPSTTGVAPGKLPKTSDADGQLSTTDVSTASLVPFALAKLAFETASSSSKPSPSTTGVAQRKLPKTSDAAKGSAKTPSEKPAQDSTTTTSGPGICTKLSSTNIAIKPSGETSAVESVSSLPVRATTEPAAVSATPSPASAAAPSARASSARASLATDHLSTQSIASRIDTRNVRPATSARAPASPRVKTLPSSWTLSGPAPSSKATGSAARASAMSATYGDKTFPSSEAHSDFVKSLSVERGETRSSAVTSLSGNDEKVVEIPPALQNSETLSPQQSEHATEASKDEMADTFQSGEALPELSATKRALTRMTFIAKSIKIKSVPSPANRLQERLLMLQRSLKDKLQELQILEELLKTPLMTPDKLIQFRHENRDLAKRLNGNSMDLEESFDSDMDNSLEGATSL